MSDSSASVQALQGNLVRLRLRFADRAGEQALALGRAATEGSGRLDRDALSRLSHSLAGACGIFGFPEISKAAGTLEDALAEEKSDSHIRPLITTLAKMLRQMIAQIDADENRKSTCETVI